MNTYYMSVGHPAVMMGSEPVLARSLDVAFRRAAKRACGRQDWKHWIRQGKRYVKVTGRTHLGMTVEFTHGFTAYGDRL